MENPIMTVRYCGASTFETYTKYYTLQKLIANSIKVKEIECEF